MPKRVIDAEAVWGSTKLAHCRQEFIPEYTWLYGLADANGNFEMNDLRVIHGKVAAIRPHFTLDTLQRVFEDFKRHGLLFTWEERGKKYGHWTGSNKPGRLPPKSQRDHYPKLDVRTPSDEEIQKYWDSLAVETPVPTLFPTPVAVRIEAEQTLKAHTDAAAKNGDEPAKFKQDKWRAFWELYPNHQDELSSRELFMRLDMLVMDDVIAAVVLYKASSISWQQGDRFVPKARNWLQEENWKKTPPKETPNARRTLGPAGRTREDQLERMRKNAKTLGLDRP
jgi:hypothetical protein